MANPNKASFYANDPIFGVPGPHTATQTSALWGVGDVVGFADYQTGASSINRGAGNFMYLQGSNVTAIGQVVQISAGSAVLLNSANSASYLPVGVAAGNLSATNVFGWVQVYGSCDYLLGTNANIAAGVPLYMAATAGNVVSTPAAGSRIEGIVPIASYTSSDIYALVFLNNPRIIGVTASL